MATVPGPPPSSVLPLAPGWTQHTAPSGHVYYYNDETKKSTYTRPIAEGYTPAPPPLLQPPPVAPAWGAYSNFYPSNTFTPQSVAQEGAHHDHDSQGSSIQYDAFPQAQVPRGSFNSRGSHRGGRQNFQERRKEPVDRPKHRDDIPNCAPWVLVRTKLGRRFVWNKETNESFWKFPADVMKAVIDFDRIQREKRERRERGEPSEDEADDAAAMAEIEAQLEAEEAEVQAQIVEVDGDPDMEDEEEYEEVEVTDDEGELDQQPSKRQRTEEPQAPPEDDGMEMGEDDMEWQLAALESAYNEEGMEDEEEEGMPLTEDDCKALFKELLDDLHVSPFTPWDKVLEDDRLYEDDRYKALSNMKARKDCFSEWAKDKAQFLKELKAKQQKLDPRIPYLAFLQRLATPKLYWPEFKRKYKKEPEMKDQKLSDKDKERLYRDHVKRLGMRSSDLRHDLTMLLKEQPLTALNRTSTSDTLPPSILTDLRFISLPASTRDSLIEEFVSRLPPPPEGTGPSVEEQAQDQKRRTERQRREKALADRERKVREDKRRQESELAYGKGRLREEEIEIERALKVGKDGLRGQLSGFGDDAEK